MNKILKQNIPVFFDEDGNPIAVIVFDNRKRIIYNLKEAGEDDLIELYEKKDKTIKSEDSLEFLSKNIK